jgi:ribonuclease HI
MIQVWTDGCCLKNPGGPGGWAFIVVDEQQQVVCKESGGEPCSTNNRMEMAAVIEGIKVALDLFPTDDIEIVSDSLYVVKGSTVWLAGWKKRGWRRSAGRGRTKPVKNEELWRQIDALLRPQVTLLWVKGHNGARFNELADFMAKEAASEHA